jgi:hypothetical protein
MANRKQGVNRGRRGDPIAIGGGGGRRKGRAVDYVTIDFNHQELLGANGEYSRAGYRIATLVLKDKDGNPFVDCTKFLPDDRNCTLHFYRANSKEIITMQGNPISISFDESKFPPDDPRNPRKHTRVVKLDKIGIDLPNGEWNSLEIGTPKRKFSVELYAEVARRNKPVRASRRPRSKR